MHSLPTLVSAALLSLVTLQGCSSSDPPATAETSDAGDVVDAADSAIDDASADVAADVAVDAGKDAGQCFECSTKTYTCINDANGQPLGLNVKKNADGTCAFGGMTLVCGGTGTDASGNPLKWSAGPGVGPSGGPGIHIAFANNAQVNCE